MSVIEQGKIEMELAGIRGDDQRVMIEIMEKFFDQWDSGGAVAAMAPVLQRLIAAKPLSPLTGADSEWFQPQDDVECYQNRRCSTVFKEKDAGGAWIAYDIGAKDTGDYNSRHRWAHKAISFPYSPAEAVVSSPVVEINTDRVGR